MLPLELQNIIKEYIASMVTHERKLLMQMELRFAVSRWHHRQLVLGIRRIATFCYLH